jgi:hypothetical protein
MKNLLYLIILVALLSCEGEPLVKEPNLEFGEPYPSVNGGNNVWLRPYIGFSDYIMRNEENSYFTYYCDTSPEPTTIVRYDKSNYPWVVTSDPLKPNTKYYWYCMASVDAKYTKGSCKSETYSFQTIDTSLMFNRTWYVEHVLDSVNYYNIAPERYSLYDYNFYGTDEEVFGNIFSFTVTRDSVFEIEYYGVFDFEAFPQKGEFKFAYDSLKILDKKFEFINFGMNRDESLGLVIKIPETDYVFIYKSNKK